MYIPFHQIGKRNFLSVTAVVAALWSTLIRTHRRSRIEHHIYKRMHDCVFAQNGCIPSTILFMTRYIINTSS